MLGAKMRALSLGVAVLGLLACATQTVTGTRSLQQVSDLLSGDWLSLPDVYDSSPNSGSPGYLPCQDDQFRCFDTAVKEMQKRFVPLKDACSHNAIFALLYMRVTDKCRMDTKANCGANQNSQCLWVNAKFLTYYAVTFAKMYLSAQSNYDAKQMDRVPEPWRIAFEAAEKENVTGTGNLLIGVNAHVNHDLPFAVETALRNFPAYPGNLPLSDGRKTDHDKVNDVLLAVNVPAQNELAARFDSTITASDVPGTTIDNTAVASILIAWREDAWQKGTQLYNAATPQARDLIVKAIKDYSTQQALSLRDQYNYDRLGGTGSAGRAKREAECLANKNNNCYPTCP